MATLFLFGRIMFGGFFLYNAYGHLVNHKGTTGYAKMKGIPAAGFMTAVSGLMLLFGGISVMFGYYPVAGLQVLLAFMVPTTFLMHKFWRIQDPMQRMGERIAFMKNCAIIGALLMMFILPTIS